MKTLYVRTTLTVPGAGTAIHIAEMQEISDTACSMQRIIALAPDDSIAGAATPHASVGNADIPQQVVPHPNTYDEFPDIEAEFVSALQFHSLWTEATALYGEV
ncbi:hypothetical protein [Corynebacterium minutissimum]|uniref:Uncharacterized protein n=1 Tax=Corynebacterium minutissimum TaxID=38301 RepID=A0A376CR84_9CORY|nr:hypothetical protein [Corynebacterium minutissimum]QRP62035.1 hypothetical protein I6J26_05855 [Corynebacterium minutissimum]STC73208.1 Uncharacterised protein [Corynebacterium minutissimum]